MLYKLLTNPHQDIEYEEPGKNLKSHHIGDSKYTYRTDFRGFVINVCVYIYTHTYAINV